MAVLTLALARPAWPEAGRGAPAQSPPSQPARDTPAAAAGGSAIIRGRVVEATTGRGLSRVLVRATTNGPQPPGGGPLAYTGADGRYEITGLAANTYAVGATKLNYVRGSWGEQRVEGPGKRFPIADGQVLEKIDLRLTRTGVITGKIVDEFGDPVTDVSVTAMRYQYIQGARRLTNSGRANGSNDVGEFRVYGLTPGQYYISATLRNFGNLSFSESTDRSAYASTFYPGTGNLAEAQRLLIAPGQTIPGINLTLLPIQTARVSGTATNADGRPMAGSMINVMQRLGATMTNNSGAPVRADGKFTLNLTPGDYTLRLFGQSGLGGGNAFMDITVSGSDIDDVRLVPERPSTIRGRIAFAPSATGAPPPQPTAIDLGAMREWAIGQPVRSPAKIKDDGTFEISAQAGRLMLRGVVTGPPPRPGAPSWRVNRVIVNDVDVFDSGLDLPANGGLDNVVVEMTDHSGEVLGTVTDASGAVVRDCFVIVFAQDPAHWTVQTRHLGVARPGLDDKFHSRLLAGDYYVAAMSDVEQGAWTDPEFLTQVRDRATKFSLADGESKTIDLVVVPAPVF